MDLDELVIRISVAADGVDAQLQDVCTKISQVSGTLDAASRKMGAAFADSAGAAGVRRTGSAVQELDTRLKGTAQTAEATGTAIGRAVERNSEGYKKFFSTLQSQSDAANASFADRVAQMQQQTQAVQTQQQATEALGESQQQTTEMVREATLRMLEGEKALRKETQQTGEAFAEAGKQAASSAGKAFAEVTKKASPLKDTLKDIGKGLLVGVGSGLTNIAINLAIDGVTSLISHIVNAKAAAEAAAEALREEHRQTAIAAQESLDSLNALSERYTELYAKDSRTLAESAEMARIQGELAKQYGIVENSVRGLAGGYDTLAESLNAAKKAQQEQAADALASVATDAKQRYVDNTASMYKDRAKAADDLAEARRTRADALASGLVVPADVIAAAEAEANLAKYNLKLVESNDLQNAFSATLADAASQAADAGKTINDSLLTALANIADMDASLVENESAGLTYADNWAQAIVGLASNPELQTGFEQLRGYLDTLNDETASEADIATATAAAKEAYAGMLDIMSAAFEARGMDAETADAWAASVIAGLAQVTGEWDEYAGVLQGKVNDAAETTQRKAKQLNKELQDSAAIKKQVTSWKELKAQYDAANKSGKSTTDLLKRMTPIAKGLGVAFDGTGKDVKSADAEIDRIGETGTLTAAQVRKSMDTLQADLAATQALMYLAGSAGMDTAPIEAAIAEIKAAIAALVAYANANDVSLTPGNRHRLTRSDTKKSSGGGGGGGGSKKDDAEEAERAAEEARKDALQADYDLLDHRRHMNEITLEEYISMLREVRTKHQLTAEEIMELEEKIYDAEQELLEKRTEQVDRLADGVVTALENRYQKMLDAETERLDESRKAWQSWSDDTTAAIQAQIDALDDLSDTEDREAKDAEELRKIAKLRQELEFEQDAYSRAKLAQQLEQASASREERLRKLALSDQKDALRKQIDAVQAAAEAQISSLDDQQAAIEKQYAVRMEQAAIEAEAEKLLMNTTQQDILSLIAGYAPEYSTTGESLGEKLAAGFISGVGDIESWFTNFNAQVEAAQQSLANEMLATSDAFYQSRTAAPTAQPAGVTVEQTNNFYTPVETPSETARRIAQVNDALASELFGAL